jgi:iron complex transport system permease protein
VSDLALRGNLVYALPRGARYGVAAGLLLVAMAASLAIGAVSLTLREVLQALLGHSEDARQAAVIWQLRLPRTLMAGLVGAGLGLAGAMTQGLFRNPIADPGLIGVSAGAAVVTAALIVFGTLLLPGGWLPYALPLGAFAGSLVVIALVSRIALVEARTSVALLLLAGIAINALAMAGTGLLVYLSDDRQMRDITFWTLGSVGGATWIKVAALAPCVILPLLLSPWFGRALDALNLGEREAAHLGFRVERVKRAACLAFALAVGGAVSVSGIIGFVGLVVPHLVRLTFGAQHRVLLPLSALGGATLLILADIVARTIVAPAELPIGLITSFVGGPFFIALLLRRRREFAA